MFCTSIAIKSSQIHFCIIVSGVIKKSILMFKNRLHKTIILTLTKVYILFRVDSFPFCSFPVEEQKYAFLKDWFPLVCLLFYS